MLRATGRKIVETGRKISGLEWNTPHGFPFSHHTVPVPSRPLPRGASASCGSGAKKGPINHLQQYRRTPRVQQVIDPKKNDNNPGHSVRTRLRHRTQPTSHPEKNPHLPFPDGHLPGFLDFVFLWPPSSLFQYCGRTTEGTFGVHSPLATISRKSKKMYPNTTTVVCVSFP